MDSSDIKSILIRYASGEISLGVAAERIDEFLRINDGNTAAHRDALDRGSFPGLILCEDKSPEEIAREFEALLARFQNVLLIKTTSLVFGRIRNIYTDAEWHESARLIRVVRDRTERGSGKIGVVAVTDDDIPIAEEAALTAETLGNCVMRLWRAGTDPNREFSSLRDTRTTIVAADNEHLPASLTPDAAGVPIIIVPTMREGHIATPYKRTELPGSRQPRTLIVNAGDGFGAGLAAGLINRRSN